MTATKLTLSATEERHFQRPHETEVANAEAKAKQVTTIVREYTLIEPTKIAFTMHLGIGGRKPELHLEGELNKIEA